MNVMSNIDLSGFFDIFKNSVTSIVDVGLNILFWLVAIFSFIEVVRSIVGNGLFSSSVGSVDSIVFEGSKMHFSSTNNDLFESASSTKSSIGIFDDSNNSYYNHRKRKTGGNVL